MLQTECDIAAGDWPLDVDWQDLASAACTAALRQTPWDGWLDSAFGIEVAVKLTDDSEIRRLNREFRGKDAATNVLAFPLLAPDALQYLALTDDGQILLGDIVLAAETVAREAGQQGKSVRDHATHLVVHGLLHLLGHDHQDDGDAERMEALEKLALQRLGIADPYAWQELQDGE